MANIKSQIKRIRTNNKAQARNKGERSSIKTAIRHFRDAIATGDTSKINVELVAASKKSKGVLHSNNAANKKSAMAKAANAAGKR